MAAPVLLILGAGANVGSHVAKAFAAKGYRIALTSRNPKSDANTKDSISVKGDLANPDTVPGIFAEVKKALGESPSVVVYNAAAATFNPPKDPLSLKLEDWKRDLDINTTSAFVAAQQAALGFKELPETASRTFIYTGNALLEDLVIPPLLDLAVGKSATAAVIRYAAGAYAESGFKFYFGDERTPDGGPSVKGVSGEAHATHYLSLAEGKEQGPWRQTFVKGTGFVPFPVK